MCSPRSATLAAVAALLLFSACAPSPPPPGTGTIPAPAEAPAEAEAARPPAVEEPEEPAAAEPPVPVSPVLRPAPLPSAEVRVRAAGELRQALERQRSGDLAGALRAFERAGELAPTMLDWVQMLAAEAAAAAGDTAGVRRRLASAEPVRVREWAWRIWERAYRQAGDAEGAIRVLEAQSTRVTDRVRQADALRALGELKKQRGDQVGALAAFRAAMEAAPQARGAREAAAGLAGLPLTPADRLLEGHVWLRHGNVERGSAAIQAYLAAPGMPAAERAESQLVLGRALFNARRYPDAERHLLAAANNSAAPPGVAAEASLLAGRAQVRAGRGDLARTTLRSTADRFPTDAAATRALFILGDLDHDAGATRGAMQHYRRAAQTRADAGDAALAAVRLANLLMLQGDAREAAAVLDEFAEGRPRDRFTAQARYWAARAYLAAGNPERARQRFQQAREADPVSYYGKLATDRLGGSLSELPLAASPRIDAGAQRGVEVALFRVDLLRELGLTEISAFEMERARAELEACPGALYLIAEAHLERGAPVAGMLLGREIQRREGAWNPRLLRIVYPFPHRELIEREARRNGLDPFMVAGLIRQESMFNPIAVSPAGAIGLMQVMPGTGRDLARRAGVSNFDPAQLRQPELNVRLGTLFLADLLRRNGNQTQAFAAYNAGPTRVARWRTLPEAREEEMFAERIPIAETRDYVKILNFNTRLYRLLYGS
jgi:soluble lytic murein transglycosylase